MDRRSIAVVALCVLLLIMWYPLMGRLGLLPAPQPAPPAASSTSAAGTAGQTPPTTESALATDSAAAAGTTPPAAAAVETPVAARPEPEGPAAPATVTLGSADTAAFVIDTGEGGITTVTLAQYLEDDRQSTVVLGRPDWAWGSLRFSNTGWVSGRARVVEQSAEKLVLERAVAGAPDLTLRQEWRQVPGRPYCLDYAVTLRNAGSESLRLQSPVLNAGATGLAGEREAARRWRLLPDWRKSMARWFGLATADTRIDVLRREKQSAQTFAVFDMVKMAGNAKAQEQNAATAVDWVAAHNKYFTSLLVPADPTQRVMSGFTLAQRQDGDDQEQWVFAESYLGAVHLAAGEEWTRRFSLYAGPKEFRNLREVGSGVEAILQMDLFFFWHPDWMGGLSRGILHAMIGLQKWIDRPWAYGMAIILTTLFFKLLFWPLTHYSTLSMRKMQKIQPLLAAAKEKFKDDPRRFQERQMEIFRENKVNPLGGCLPVLLQIPVFFALYNVLRCAIELRQASFLWVGDLSLPDTLPWEPLGIPLRPLGAACAVTMFLQQKITPTAMEPTQARVMQIMMGLFALIFYAMPSGLTLYWTVNNMLSIGQMLITYRLVQDQCPLPAAPAKGAKK